MPLKILIVGAGIGGLTAAIALREQGHEVTIFEQSQFASEYGAAIHIQPNANGILRRLGIFLEESGANSLDWMTEYTSTGSLNRSMDLVEVDKKWHHPWLLAHRVQLHSHLKSHALTPSPPHPPITLLTSHKVISLNPSTTTLYFPNGTSHTGDLIIGADGVHSLTRSFIQSPSSSLQTPSLSPSSSSSEIKPFPSQKSAYRFLLTRQKVLSNPKTAKYMQKPGELIMWFGSDRRVIIYPTSNNSLLNFVCLHPDYLSECHDTRRNGDEGKEEAWGKYGYKENLLKIYEGWDEDMVEMLRMAPSSSSSPETTTTKTTNINTNKNTTETLKVWRLLDMKPLPTFHNENLVLMGDAAHPYLPHQGQGAGSAIEDAAALAVILGGLGKMAERGDGVGKEMEDEEGKEVKDEKGKGEMREEMRERLKLYEQIRMGRAHRIQEFSRVLGRDPADGGNVVVDIRQFVNHNLQHDEWDNSTHELRKWLWKRNPQLAGYYLIPASFGPLPGPTQNYISCASTSTPHSITNTNTNINTISISISAHKTSIKPLISTKTTLILTFTTSRTLLQNFFPIDSNSFRFASEGMISRASWRFVSWDWGEGEKRYEQLWFCIEGVEYVKEDGEVVRGTFVPVVFESQSDRGDEKDAGDGEEDWERGGQGKKEGYAEMQFEAEYTTSNTATHTYKIHASIPATRERWGTLTLEDLTEVSVVDKEELGEKAELGEEDEEGLLLWRYDEPVSPLPTLSSSPSPYPLTPTSQSINDNDNPNPNLNPKTHSTNPNPNPASPQGHLHYIPPSPKPHTKKYTSSTGTFSFSIPTRTRTAKTAKTTKTEASQKSPTHQIISRLSEIPYKAILSAKIECECESKPESESEMKK